VGSEGEHLGACYTLINHFLEDIKRYHGAHSTSIDEQRRVQWSKEPFVSRAECAGLSTSYAYER
jgi:hypothetical protein